MENNLQDAVVAAKDKMPNVTPTPPGFHSQATAYELKSRLNWGEPGLTIVDVRDHDAFNQCRIQGAITMPMPEFLEMAKTALLPGRDIYVYGASDEDTASAANMLREAGFSRVAELKGGLEAWRELNGPVEGVATMSPSSPGSTNVSERLKEFSNMKAKEKQMK
jgi:rhodanese-related sulfurtransferase